MIRNMVFPLLVFVGSGWIYGQQDNLNDLIRKIDERSKTYKEYHEYSASAVSVYKEMDNSWKPGKVTSIFKQIRQVDSSRVETITRAVEIQKGKETDITEKVLANEKKRQDRAKGKTEDAKQSKKEGRNQTFAVGYKELYPFSDEERKQYIFSQKPDTVLSGKPLLHILASARERTGNRYEGSYFVDPQTYDILLIDAAPAKNPKFVKDMRIRMAFEVLPGNYWMFKSYRMRIFASLLIKKVRIEAEETYSDFTIVR